MASPGSKPNSPPLDPRAREEAEQQDRRRGDAVARTCGDLEEALEQLRTRYDLYFLGVERREPARDREEMRRAVARVKGETNLGTGLRFRVETLHARFLAYDRMWTRTARQKEDGTYRRDIHRLRRRNRREAEAEAKRESAAVRSGPGSVHPERSVGGAESTGERRVEEAPPPATTGERARPGPMAAGAPGGRTPEPTPLPPGLSPDRMRALYDEYVEARRRCNEDVSRVTYEALARTVARQVPELMARFNARSVEFKVAVEKGRAVLKALPRA